MKRLIWIFDTLNRALMWIFYFVFSILIIAVVHAGLTTHLPNGPSHVERICTAEHSNCDSPR